MRLSTWNSNGGGGRPDSPGTNRMVMGPVHYAEVGTPIRYYFEGISLCNETTTWSHFGPGTLYSDRWEWTPDEPGESILKLRDSVGGQRTQRIIINPNSGIGTLNLFLYGDSISAWDGYVGWVPALRAKLVSEGITANFKGPRQNLPNPIANVYHNALSGRTYGLGELWVPGPGASATSWVSTYGQPSIAICALGTNDHSAYSDAQGMIYARAVVNTLLNDTDARVAITLMYPHNPAIYDGSNAQSISRIDYLEALQIEFATEIASGSVHLLNVHGACTYGDFYDGLHPDVLGHPKILDQIYPWVRGVITGAI